MKTPSPSEFQARCLAVLDAIAPTGEPITITKRGKAVAPPLVRVVPVSPAIAADVAALPPPFHRDPADRILVSTARVWAATLLTKDRRIADARLVPVIA